MSPTTATTADLAELDADIDAVIARARYAGATSHSVDLAHARFSDWCASRELTPMPADTATVGAYLAWMAAGEVAIDGTVLRPPYALATIRAAKAAIGIAHDRAGFASPASDPWVCLVMAGIARSPWLRPARQMSPLGIDQMRALMALPAPLPTLPSLRDRALLLTAAQSGWPLGELIALRRDQVHLDADRVGVRRNSGAVLELAPAAASAMRALQEALPARVSLAFGVRGTDHAPRFLDGSSTDEIAALTATIRQALRKCAGLPLRVREPLPDLDGDGLTRLLLSRDPRTVRWLRDRALLLTAWHLALRGDEVGGIAIDDVRRDPRGYTAWLGRTKNDQLATGTPLSLLPTRDPLLDPVRALDGWITYRAPAGPGALFCRLDGAQCRPQRGVSAGDDVLDIVRAWTTAAGLDGRYGAHSLRIGFVVSAIRAGASIAEIMTVTRQRSPEMVGYYGRAEQAAGRRAPKVLLARARGEAA